MKKCGGFLLSFLLLISPFVRSEMVDTFVFQSHEERARAVALAKSLRCPQCQNQNLVESNSPIAYDLRLEVYKMVDEGRTNEQIITQMTERFGDFVRYDPPLKWTTVLLWFTPILLLLMAFFLMARYASKKAKRVQQTGLDVQQQQELQKLLRQSTQEPKQ